MQIFGISDKELRDAVLFYQRFKDTPTYAETLRSIKREHLESELGELE